MDRSLKGLERGPRYDSCRLPEWSRALPEMATCAFGRCICNWKLTLLKDVVDRSVVLLERLTLTLLKDCRHHNRRALGRDGFMEPAELCIVSNECCCLLEWNGAQLTWALPGLLMLVFELGCHQCLASIVANCMYRG